MPKLTFLNPVKESLDRVERIMLDQADGYHPDLRSALEHLLSSGGKRVRPAITLLTGRMLGAEQERNEILAAAIELLHTATLVHDDLIDSALLRRGIPTLNSQWSPASTVLTGDFIFSRAAKLAAETNSLPVINLFAQTLTIIVNGELTQLFSDRCESDRDQYTQRIYAKTASLFETATTSAAYISNVDEMTTHAIGRFGFEVGMAFQILDDILDFTSEETTLGKPVGSDLRQGLVTLPTILFFELYPDDTLADSLKLGKCPSDEMLEQLINSIRQSGAIPAAHAEACNYVQRGLVSLRRLPDSIERQALEALAQYIVEREL